MDDNAPIGRFAPLILRVCFVLIFGGLISWHASVLHTKPNAKPEALARKGTFSTPRTLYPGKRIIEYDRSLVQALAFQRITQFERESWHVTSGLQDSIAEGCSSLYPSTSPASSCWQANAGLQEQSVGTDESKKPLKLKVSFLEVPKGETVMSAIAKRAAAAIDQATIDAQADAISKGMSASEAQMYAESHRQYLLQSDPEQLATQQLPTFDLESLELQSLFPEVRLAQQTIGGGENSAQMAAALSGMLRSIIEDYESKMSRLEDGADDYEEPSLEDGDIEVINETYRHIRDMLPINLHGHPACPNVPSLAPVPTKLLNTPWPPFLRQLLSEMDKAESAGNSSDTNIVRSAEAEAAYQHESGDTSTLDASAAWQAANTAQKNIEESLQSTKMPPMPDMRDYARVRLQQMSQMSQRIDEEYHKLFLKRAKAKQLLLEQALGAAEAHLRTSRGGDQLSRLMSITRFAMGPVSDEQQAIDSLWRDLVYMATLQTRAAACVSTGGLMEQCYNQAALGSRPTAYAPFKSLSASQQQELRSLMGDMFNVTVPQPPVRMPVMHWDERVDGTAQGQRLDFRAQAASEEQAVRSWMEGTGEPRQDAWQVMESLAGRHTDAVAAPMRDLQASAIEKYIDLQLEQLLSHIETWSKMMQPEKIREIVMEWRLMRTQEEAGSHNTDAVPSATTSDELMAQLRTKLLARSEGGQEER